MQNFPDAAASPAPHRGFSSVTGARGRNSSYQLQPSELQSSSRMPDEYAGMQPQNSQTQNQHPSLHTNQAALLRGYEARNRGRHGSNDNNPYRKETMDYYFLMSSKEGQRRGSHGFEYGAGLGFQNLDGHVPHQYRSNRPASGTASGVSQYPMDYSVAAAVNRSGGTATFSPSHQYSMAPNPSVTGPPVRHQQAQNYPSQQVLHQEQLQRSYSLSGRLPTQFSNCLPPNTTAGSAGKYNSSPQRYYSGGNGGKCKMNDTASANSSPCSNRNSTNPASTRPFEGMGQGYTSSDYPYNSNLAHSHHHHHPQNMGPSHATSHKMHPSNLLNQPELSYAKHPPCSMSSSQTSTSSTIPPIHQLSSHEVTKSPMHNQTQQPNFQQNFSPISNPSPPASLVHSPSCSSSPSPLMGISEGQGNSTGPPAHQPSYSLSNLRNSQNHNRLLQVMTQHSPTPNSNSSNSSCGSSGHVNTSSQNTTSLNTSPGGNHSVPTRRGERQLGSDRCTSSSHYSISPLEKQALDPGTNSLNALTSQVANLSSTVQHVLVSDPLLLNNEDKDNRHRMQPSLHASPTNQQRTVSDSSSRRVEGSRIIDSHDIKSEGGTDEHITELSRDIQVEGKEHPLKEEDDMVRQLSETNSVDGLTGGIPVHQDQANSLTERDRQGSPFCVDMEVSKKQKRTRSSQSLTQSTKADYKAYSSISPSSISSHIPSEGHSTVQIPPCPSPAPCTTRLKSPAPSPTLICSPQPTCFEEPEVPLVIPKNELSGREWKADCDATKKKEMETNKNKVEQFQGDKCRRVESHDIIEMHTRRENEGEIRSPLSFNNQEEKGRAKKQEMLLDAEETHMEGGVGVIVSTRSEVIRSETVSERPQATSTLSLGPDLTNNLGIPNYCPNRENHSYSSFRDSRSYNGEGDISGHIKAATCGAKLPGRHSASPHHLQPGSQKSPYRFSESFHGSLNNDRVRLSEDGMAPKKLNDQQPPQHIVGLLKKMETGEVEGQSKRSIALESGKGHDNSVQQHNFPSLLQEVLQGYHTEKRYRYPENLPQQLKTRNSPQNMPYQYPHSRLPNSMTESVRNHFLSQSRMNMNCHIPNEPPSRGKGYSNQRREGVINMDQDTCRSWSSGGAGSREILWGSFDRSKMIDSSSHQGNNMQQSSEGSLRPHSKNSCSSDNARPTRKPTSNELNSTSAVQQLLLKEEAPSEGNEPSVGQVRPHTPSLSSPLSSLSSLERRSVICDLSPSPLTTPEKDRSSDKRDKVSILPQTWSSGSSVIQQSLSTSVLNQEDSPREEKVCKAMFREEALKIIKEDKNSKPCDYSHSFMKETSIQPQNRMQLHSGQLDTIPGPPRAFTGGNGSVKTGKTTPVHPQHAPQQLLPPHNPLSSTPLSKFQAYFQSLDEPCHHSAGIDGFGLRDSGERTVKMNPRHHYQPSHHNLPSSQTQISLTANKLKMYPHCLSLQHLHSLNDRFDWGTNDNQPSSQDLMMSPNSSRNQHHAGIRSTTDVLANPPLPPHQGSYYDMKMWGPLSDRENKGMMEGDVCRRNKPCPSVDPPGPVPLLSKQPEVSKNSESSPSRIIKEEVKSFHPMSTLTKKSDCSSINSGSGNGGNLGPQGKAKMGGSGDTNPLMMRRRVRSFISPIPAKRQHQDMSQQQQQSGVSSMNPALSSKSDMRHSVDTGPFSPDVPNHKTVSSNASLVSPSPSLEKMDDVPPRKGRGLKLEAIVQKITPCITQTNDDSESNTDSTSDNLSSLSHTEMTYISDLKDHNSSFGGHFSRMETGSGSCLPYLNDGISLEEMMSYRGVEETGFPTAYQCDPHQDTRILKCELTEKPTREAAGDLESVLDYGIGVPRVKSEIDTAGNGVKDEISPDFALLGPLPPPPPLPRPVQVSSPPSSSALSDIQQFTTTYQQLETRREHSAATLLRQKLEESEMCLGLDDYSGRDYLGTKLPNHNQDQSNCALSIPLHNQLHPQHVSAGTNSSVVSQSQYTHMKSSDNMVPRGYFPSGKKRGRPVGSVNKQKRAQGQSQNVSLNESPVTQIPTYVSAATPQTVVQSISPTISINETNSEDQTTASLASLTATPAAKEEIESEERDPEMEPNPCKQKGRKKEHVTEADEVVIMPTEVRRVVDAFEEEVKSAGITGNVSPIVVFPTCSRRPVFAPYVHVENRFEELGNVCTIVNGEDEKKRYESGAERGGKLAGKEVGGGSVTPVNSTLISQLTRVKDKRGAEKVNASHIHPSPTEKVLPSSGYVISGSVMSEIDSYGHLLCCLCKKWANYKDLGDLYGPFYPPEYVPRFPRTPSVIRQSLGVGTVGALAGAAEFESAKQEITPVAFHSYEPIADPGFTGNQAPDPLAATSTDTKGAVSTEDRHRHCSNNDKQNEDWDLTQKLTSTGEVLKQEELPNEVLQLLPSERHMENTQKRPQHRKLTSHPRFKRRHKSSEDLPKTGPTNSKALLPFQPPPPLPLPNQDSSDPSAPLSLLPQVPLDPDELWVHEGCIIWASGVYLVNGRLYGVQEALDGAKDTCCSHCMTMGSTLGCYSKGCTLSYHYLCATEAGCALNEDNFSLRCPKHKFPQNHRPVKHVYPEQSERG